MRPLRFPIRRGSKTDLTFRLSRTGAAAIGAVAVCAVAWAFFMGLMVGRGQNPEQRMEDLTGISLSSRNADTAGRELEAMPDPPEPGGEQTAAAAAASTLPAAPPPALPAPGHAIPGQALPGQTLPVQAADAQKQQDYPFGRPEGDGLAAWGAQGEPAAGRAAAQKHEYVFQAAAFRSGEEAARLARRLSAAGLRAGVRKSGKMSLTVVRYRGDEAGAEDTARQLEEMGLGRPLRLSRTELSRPAPAARANAGSAASRKADGRTTESGPASARPAGKTAKRGANAKEAARASDTKSGTKYGTKSGAKSGRQPARAAPNDAGKKGSAPKSGGKKVEGR